MTTDRPDLDLLADLDAGLLDEPQSGDLRAAALADPASAAVLDALTVTRAELAALPRPVLPPATAARWTAALDDAALEPTAPEQAARDQAAGNRAARERTRPLAPRSRHIPIGPTSGRGSSRPPAGPRRRRPRPAVVAGIALVAVLVGVGLVRSHAATVTVSGVELAAAGRAALGVGEAGEFAKPSRRSACLRSVSPPGVAADSPLLGGRGVELDGRPGVLMVLGTGELGSFDVVVVGPGCDALLTTLRVSR